MADVVVCSTVAVSDVVYTLDAADIKESAAVSEKIHIIDTVRVSDSAAAGENTGDLGYTPVRERAALDETVSFTSSSIVWTKERAAVADRVFSIDTATVQDSALVSDVWSDATAEWISAIVSTYAAVLGSAHEALSSTRVAERVAAYTVIWDRSQVSVIDFIAASEQVALADTSRITDLVGAFDRAHLSSTTYVATYARASDGVYVTTYLPIEKVVDSVQALVSARAMTHGGPTVQSSAVAYDHIQTLDSLGIVASVTWTEDGQAHLAHSFHDLPPVDWALDGRVGTSDGVRDLDAGDPMPNSLLLGYTYARTGHQAALKSLWLPEGALSKTRVHDGKYERVPRVRGEEARFDFGRGAFGHRWELNLSNFTDLKSVMLRLNVSKRRY